MVGFGEKLKSQRISKGISQEKLAKSLNVTKSMVSAYETEIRMPSYEVLVRIASYFNISTDYLLGLEQRQFLDTSQLSERQLSILSSIIDEFRSGNRK